MKSLLSVCVAALVAVSTFSLVGCSGNQNPPPEHGGTAGGNGAFGTNPVRPGSYAGENDNHQGMTPTTQPSNP